jgi:potassium channel subfamily K
MRFPYNTRHTWAGTDASTVDTDLEHADPTKKDRKFRRHAHQHQHAPHHNHQSQSEKLLHDWSWLSGQSPLMSSKSEAEWILDRLSAALERELDRQRKGRRRHPPISLRDVRRRGSAGVDEKKQSAE